MCSWHGISKWYYHSLQIGWLGWNYQMLRHLKIQQHQHQCVTCPDMSKKHEMCQTLGHKNALPSMLFSYFCAFYSTCPKEFKNGINNQSAELSPPLFIIWYALTRSLQKLTLQQIMMLQEFYKILV